MPRSCLWSAISPHLKAFRNVCPYACHSEVGLDSNFAGEASPRTLCDLGPSNEEQRAEGELSHLCHRTEASQNQAE